MDLIVRLAKVGDDDVADFSVNRESIFDFAKFDAVRDALCLLLACTSERSDDEKTFLATWLQDFETNSRFIQKISRELEERCPDAASAKRFVGACERLLATMKNSSELGTAYKILFLGALHSTRDRQLLRTMLATARRIFALPAFTYLLITDGIARVLPGFPYRPAALSQDEREHVVALACQMLAVDTEQHAHERTMFRLIMASVGLPQISPARLGELTKRSQSELIVAISDQADHRACAIFSLMRVMFADHSLKASEGKILQSAVQASALPKEQVAELRRFAELEV